MEFKNINQQLKTIRKLDGVKKAEIDADGKLVIYTIPLPLQRERHKTPSFTAKEVFSKLVVDLEAILHTSDDFVSVPESQAYPFLYTKEKTRQKWQQADPYKVAHRYILYTSRLCLGKSLITECREALQDGDIVMVAIAVMLLIQRGMRTRRP